MARMLRLVRRSDRLGSVSDGHPRTHFPWISVIVVVGLFVAMYAKNHLTDLDLATYMVVILAAVFCDFV